MLGLGTEEVDGGGAASGDEAEELGAEEFAATPAVVAHLESRRRSWARRRSPAVVTHLDSGVEVEEKLDRGKPVRLAGSFHCWFVKKYCWLVYVREKYYFDWKFTIVYDRPQPNEQANGVGGGGSGAGCK